MSVYYNYRNSTKNLFKFSLHFMSPSHSQTAAMDVTAVLFIEFPDLQVHYDPVFGSLYITSTYRFRLYFFALRDFAIPLFHPQFDPATPYIAIALHMAYPAPPAPLATTPPASPPTSPPQVIPALPSESDPSEELPSSSSSSFECSVNYIPIKPGMANGFLSPEPM